LCGTRAAEKSVQAIPPLGSSVQRVAVSVAGSSARTAPTVANADATQANAVKSAAVQDRFIVFPFIIY
jgi:hypothetical protein